MIRLTSRPRPGHPCFAGAPLLIAHRGGAALAPENTLVAFRNAVENWDADLIETDVRLTADGRVVIMHDPTVDRTTDGSGAVAEMTWRQLRDFDAAYHYRDANGEHSLRGTGVRIPLFAELLEALPQARFIVEAKVPEVAAPLVKDIMAADADHRVIIGAVRASTLAGARHYPGPQGASKRQVTLYWLLHHVGLAGRFYTPRADGFQLPEWSGSLHVTTPRMVRAAHRANIPVYVWTVNDPADMRRLLEWGADGIMTDRPDLLAEVVSEVTGRPLPQGTQPPNT